LIAIFSPSARIHFCHSRDQAPLTQAPPEASPRREAGIQFQIFWIPDQVGNDKWQNLFSQLSPAMPGLMFLTLNPERCHVGPQRTKWSLARH